MSERGLVWTRGRVVPAEHATVSALDRGFLLGDGLFETMRARGRRVLRLDRHLERLRTGAERVGIACPAGIAEAVAELLGATGEGGDEPGEHAVRVTLSRGESGDGPMPDPAAPPTLAIWVHPLRDDLVATRERGLRLHTVAHRTCSRSAVAGVKSLGYLANVCALVDARAHGADDALLLDERGFVAEAAASNVFWVDESRRLLTPAETCGILPGITRAAVLDLARREGIPAAEGEWRLEALSGAREAFTTSSLRGIAPVIALDGSPLGEGAPGAVTRALQRAYDELDLRDDV